MQAAMTITQLADLYGCCEKAIKRKIEKKRLDIDTSSLIFPKDLKRFFDEFGHPDDLKRDEKPPNSSSGSSMQTIALILAMTLPVLGHSQIVYLSGESVVNNLTQVYRVDLATCDVCPIFTFNPPPGGDVTLLPNGSVFTTHGPYIRMFSPPNPIPTLNLFITPQSASGSILNPSGTIFLATQNGLGVFDPSNNQFTFLGNWPNSFLPTLSMELWYEGSQLFGYVGNPGNQQVVSIDVTNPANSTIVGPISPPVYIDGAINVGAEIFMSDYNSIYAYNPTNGAFTLECDLSTQVGILGLTSTPNGFPSSICLCTTNAGNIQSQSLTFYCTNQTIPIVQSGGFLDGNDILKYVLFSNPADTAGSIIATSTTPNFTFAPPMQTGVTYYVAAMAGNSLNGNVDLDDPCLDFSNANAIVWRPLPTILLAASQNNICQIGGCTNTFASIVGTPPFSFTYEFQSNGVLIGSPVSVSAASSPHIFSACVPPNAPVGALELVICSLSDFYCTAN